MSSVNPQRARMQPISAGDVAARAPALRLPAGMLPEGPARPFVRRSRRRPADKAAERGPRGGRRARRLHNEMLLVHAALGEEGVPLPPGEVKALFEYGSRSEWTRLTGEPESARVWHEFCEGDEEGQRCVLEAGAKRSTRPAPRPVESVALAFGRMDRRIRSLIKEKPRFVYPVVRDVEERVVALGPGASVTLTLRDSVSRMVAHGVAQFHSLCSISRNVGKERITVIRADAGARPKTAARLIDVLA